MVKGTEMDNKAEKVEYVKPVNPGPTVGTMARGALWLAGIPLPKQPRRGN